MGWQALNAYRQELEDNFQSASALKLFIDGKLSGKRAKNRINKGLAGFGLATFVGAWTAPIDGGALFWLIASWSGTQLSLMSAASDKRDLENLLSMQEMLDLNLQLIQNDIDAVEIRHNTLLGRNSPPP